MGIDLPTGAALGGEVEDYVIDAVPYEPSPYPDGDFNQNGVVDGDDFLIWQANFGLDHLATVHDGDADRDRDVDGDDFLVWQANFGVTLGGGAAAAAAANPLLEANRIDGRQLVAKDLVRKATDLTPVSAEDAIRFDLAMDDFDTIRPAKMGARARRIAPTAVDQAIGQSTTNGSESQGVAFETSVASRVRRDLLQEPMEKNRDELFELLAKDRIDRVSTVPTSSRSKGRFDG
jgi:hypothetical protein